MTASTTGTVPSFADVPLHGGRAEVAPTESDVAHHVSEAAAAHGYSAEQLEWHTPEGIAVKPVYVGADRDVGKVRHCLALHRYRRGDARGDGQCHRLSDRDTQSHHDAATTCRRRRRNRH